MAQDQSGCCGGVVDSDIAYLQPSSHACDRIAQQYTVVEVHRPAPGEDIGKRIGAHVHSEGSGWASGWEKT